jgi:hypothetical protein
MACSLMDCCQFFNDNMKEMPKTAEYVKDRLCRGNYEVCNRFKIYHEFGKSSVPRGLDPEDTEQVKKVLRCLRGKQDGVGVDN